MYKPTEREIRERLMTRGAEALDDTELLSLLLRDDTRGEGDSYDLAGRLLAACGGRACNLARMEIPRLRMTEGLGLRRAATLAAAAELGRRMAAQEAEALRSVSGSDDIVAMFRPQMAGLPYEEFWALYLTSSNRIIERLKISQGGVSETVVDTRLVVKRAIELLAASIILVHNHPSGSSEPSPEDCRLTERLVRAAELFDIKILDHIIISAESSTSFLARGIVVAQH